MKKIILIVLMVIIAIVGISGCTEETPKNKTYSADGITFQYPGNWTELNKTKYTLLDLGNTSKGIFVLGNQQNRLTFGKVTPGKGQALNTLPKWAQLTKIRLSSKGGQFLSEKNLTIDGANAHQLRFMSPDGGYYTGIVFIKNNTGYIMVYASIYNETETLDNILKSFKMP